MMINFDTLRLEFFKKLPFFVGAPAMMWQSLFFCLPLLFIIVLSGIDISQPGVVKFTLGNYARFMSPLYFYIIGRSLLFAFVVSVICCLLAYPLAYFIALSSGRFRNMLLFLLVLPFWTNFLLHIYAWYFFLERQGFLNILLMRMGIIREPFIILNTSVATTLMMVYYYLPFMVFPLYSSLEKFDHRLIAASLDLGATWFQTIMKVLLPLTTTAIQSGFLLVFVPSFAEFAIPELMGGDKKVFVGTVVCQLILGGQTCCQGAAFTMLSSVVLIFGVLTIYWLLARILRGRS
jgi:spermidine/putrescine transport system permease protein